MAKPAAFAAAAAEVRLLIDQEEKGCLFIPQLVKLQLVIAHNLPELGYIKGSQPCAAANQNRLCCFAAG